MVCLINDEFVPVIPGDSTKIQQAILSEFHDSALGGQFGWRKMDALVKKQFYWLSVNIDVTQLYAECDVY